MDPNTTIEILLEAAFDGNGGLVVEAAADLAGWLESGGFAPGPQSAHIASLRAGFNPLPAESVPECAECENLRDQRRAVRLALAAMLDTALAVDDLAWAAGVKRAGTDRPCDAAAEALS